MVHGTRQTVSVATEPPGATVTISGQQVNNPGEVSLRRNRDYQVVASWHGPCAGAVCGEVATAAIYSEFSWITVWGFPVIGPIVDFVSGAAWELDPDVVTLRAAPRS